MNSLPSSSFFPLSFSLLSALRWRLAARRAESSQREGREGMLIGEQYPLVETQSINERL